MRRLMVLNALFLFLCSVISLGCSTGSEGPISQSDIPDLIGTWEGLFPASIPRMMKVQILNNSLEGNMSFRNPHEPGAVPANLIAVNGKIEDGRLVILWEKNLRLDMKLRKDGKRMKLEGNYQDQASQYSGTFTLEKIK